MLSILVGSLLLTVSVKDKSDIKRVYLYQVTLTSILATSLLYLRTITVGSDNYLLPLQPMFYGLVYYVFFSIIVDLGGKEEIKKIDYGLSPREQAIAEEVIRGYSNKEIASKLFIAESTVKKHVQNINKKLGTSDRKSLIKKLKGRA
jgi:DNA-binding CsgD family transcriptional regulator